MTGAAFAALGLATISTPAGASCKEVWAPPIADRPEITCAQFTAELLLSLRGATKEQVVKAMNAKGVQWRDGNKPMLHFVSPQERLGGVMNFVLGPEDRVIRIFGIVDNDTFVWP